MGDHTFAGVTVYACPPDQVAPLLDVLRPYFEGSVVWDGSTSLPDDDSLDLGEQYTDHMASAGVIADEIVPKLRQAAPGATWWAVESDEGGSFRFAPDLGVHEGHGEDGDMYSGADIMATFDRAAFVDGSDVRAALDKLTGGPWDRRFSELRQQDQRTVHAYPLCATCGEDRVRTNPDAINPAAWPLYHVESGREACDDTVVLRLARDDHPYQGMPAEYVGPVDADEDEAEQGPAVVVAVVLPNGRTIHVGLDEVTWPRVATAPEQTGAEQ